MLIAISVEIHAAIVGGVISGGVVLLGVLVAEGMRRRSARTEELRQATRLVVIRYAIAMSYLTETPPDEHGFSLGSPGWEVYQEVFVALVGIDVASRSKWSRRCDDIRQAREDLSARLHTAWYLYTTKKAVVSMDQYMSASGVVADLNRAVFGERDTIDALLDKYQRDGLPTT